MKTEFKLIGLSVNNRCTVQVGDTDKDWFHANTSLAPDRFAALFNYFKSGENAWAVNNRVIIQHDGFYDSGIPINPVVTEFILP